VQVWEGCPRKRILKEDAVKRGDNAAGAPERGNGLTRRTPSFRNDKTKDREGGLIERRRKYSPWAGKDVETNLRQAPEEGDSLRERKGRQTIVLRTAVPGRRKESPPSR